MNFAGICRVKAAVRANGVRIMIIGVDATCRGNKRGFGRFTNELLESLLEVDTTNEYLFFVDRDTADNGTPARVKTIVANTEYSPMKAASADGRRSFKDLWAMSRQVLRHKVDISFFQRFIHTFRFLTGRKSL